MALQWWRWIIQKCARPLLGCAAQGVAVVTLVSDVPGSERAHFVGIDNSAAGRTAATLMGRYLRGRKGSVGVIAGSLSLRDHAERHFGFMQVMQQEYAALRLLPVIGRAGHIGARIINWLVADRWSQPRQTS